MTYLPSQPRSDLGSFPHVLDAPGPSFYVLFLRTGIEALSRVLRYSGHECLLSGRRDAGVYRVGIALTPVTLRSDLPVKHLTS